MLISILLWLLFGALVGWIAGMIMKSKRSFVGNIILGIIGSFVGGFIASLIGFGSLRGGFSFDIVNILISVGGACLVIFIAGILKPNK
jgi:uncharacterized membrane protein YeaQ/YmgE (transglycosylase-associated protein family)